MDRELTIGEVYRAQMELRDLARHPKIVGPTALSDNCEIFLKPENLQHTGAFKLRGAAYKISQLTDEEKKRGVIACSAGNHAQGVAMAAQKAGCRAVIVMPTTTPLVKVNNTKALGAEVVLFGGTFDDAAAKAHELETAQGLTYIPPFNDATVSTGQGTIAYEIFSDLPDVDVILVPIGGGGLCAGVATLTKLLNPNVRVIGVEPSGAASMKAALQAGKPVTLDSVDTIADGVAVKTVGDVVFPYIQKYVDDVITINDDELVDAFLDMMESTRWWWRTRDCCPSPPSTIWTARTRTWPACSPGATWM